MRHVANVNGVSVYSDQAINSIVNGRINFADGSWCDASTGQVSNKGNGSIILRRNGQIINQDVQEVEEEEFSLGPIPYNTSTLEIRGVEAEVEIQPSDGSEMVVSINGMKFDVDNIEVVQRDAQLVISPKKGAETKMSSAFYAGHIRIEGELSIRGSIWDILRMWFMMLVNILRPSASILIIQTSNGGVIQTVVGQPRVKVKIRVDVPRGSTVRLIHIQGEVQVGDTDGPFFGSSDSSWAMTVGKVQGAHLSTSGDGDIVVQEVNGELTINIEDDGSIEVAQGNVTSLMAKTEGNGNITFGGTAKDATLITTDDGSIRVKQIEGATHLSTSGDGDIVVQEVNGELTINIEDDGSIEVAQGNVTSLMAKTEGNGNITFGGTAKDATLITTDDGSIRVKQIEGATHLSTSGDGDIVVQEVNGELTINIEDDGSIEVAQGNVTSLMAKTEGNGNITFGGTAKDATLITTDDGSIRVKSVVGRLVSKESGYGEITIDQS